MNTIIFEQRNKKAAQQKMRRLTGSKNYGTIGFCNFSLIRNFPISYRELEQNPYIKEFWMESEKDNVEDYWAIKAYSTYHDETTMRNMYKTNGKKW
jgi:hypothetical protein